MIVTGLITDLVNLDYLFKVVSLLQSLYSSLLSFIRSC